MSLRTGIVDRLRADGRIVDALRFLLGVEVDAENTFSTRCLRHHRHRNGDAHPSMIVEPRAGGVRCAACGFSSGILGIAVEQGRAESEHAAAVLLEEHFYGCASPQVAPSPAGTARPPWPYFHSTIAKILGWELTTDNGEPAIRLTTWHANGARGKSKVRWQKRRGATDQRARFEGVGRAGFLNLPAAMEYAINCADEVPVVVYASSETDIAAWTDAAQREGLSVPAFGSATGENSGVPPDVAARFKGCRVLVFADRDEAGRKAAPHRVAEFAAAGAFAEVRETPEGTKDLCDHVLAGGTIRGFLDPLPAAEAVSGQPAAPARRFTDVGAGDLLAADLPPLKLLVEDGVIPERGLALLVARQKRGKTIAALGLALTLVRRTVPTSAAVAAWTDDEGVPVDWLGSRVVGSGSVIYLCGEGGELLIRERLRKMAPTDPADVLNRLRIIAKRPWANLARAEDLAEIAKLIRESGAVLLIIDPLARFLPVEDENSAAEMSQVLGRLRALAEDTGCAILLLHHDAKAAKEPGVVTGGRGSSVLGAEMDTLINMAPDPDGDRATSHVYFETRWAAGPDACRVTIDQETLSFRFVARLGEKAARRTRQPVGAAVVEVTALRLAEVLRDSNRPLGQKEWADRAGCGVRTLRRRLEEILRSGSVIEEPRGRSATYRWVSGAHRGQRAASGTVDRGQR